MLKKIKEIFTFENIISCFIEAIGFGVGYAIPNALGANLGVCAICCIIVGVAFNYIMDGILDMYVSSVSKGAEILSAVIVFFIYICFWYFSKYGLDYNLDIEVAINFIIIVFIQIFGLVVSLVMKYMRKLKK